MQAPPARAPCYFLLPTASRMPAPPPTLKLVACMSSSFLKPRHMRMYSGAANEKVPSSFST